MKLNRIVNAIRITDEMLCRRDCLRGLFGDEYPNVVAPAVQIIRAVMERDGCGVVPALSHLVRRAIEDDRLAAASMLVAAACDLAEEA